MLRRTEFYPWPNGPCYRALCSLGLGGFPPAGARADQAGGASQVSDSQSTRSLRRPSPGDDGICGGTLALTSRSGPPGTGVFWCQTISNHAESSARNHTTSKRLRGRGRAPRTILAGGGSQVAGMFPACERRVVRCCSRASRPRDARAYARLRPWLLQTAVLLVLMGYSRGLSRGKRCTGLLKHRK